MTIFKKIQKIIRFVKNRSNFSSKFYWEQRYLNGGTSGAGSYGLVAEFNSSVVNRFVADNDIKVVIDFGCGDGNQLLYAKYPKYIGLDVSSKAIEICKEKFGNDETKFFIQYNSEYIKSNISNLKGDLTLSMEVIFHIIEDEVYLAYLHDLFACTDKYVCIYSTDIDNPEPVDNQHNKVLHVRHRNFTKDIAKYFPNFELIKTIETPLDGRKYSKFFFFRKHME